LIYGTPEIVPLLADGDAHFIQGPLITGSGTPAMQLIGILLPKLAASLADGFVRDDHPTDEQQLFSVTMTD
jgi:hypothetical protein